MQLCLLKLFFFFFFFYWLSLVTSFHIINVCCVSSQRQACLESSRLTHNPAGIWDKDRILKISRSLLGEKKMIWCLANKEFHWKGNQAASFSSLGVMKTSWTQSKYDFSFLSLFIAMFFLSQHSHFQPSNTSTAAIHNCLVNTSLMENNLKFCCEGHSVLHHTTKSGAQAQMNKQPLNEIS